MKSSDRAWITLVAGVVGWNLWCEDGMTFSERMDDYLIARPVLTRLVVTVVAAHLINATAPRYDVIHVGFVALRRISR